MPTREWSPLTTHWLVNLEDSVPRQRTVVGIGEHHTASPNKLVTLDLFRPGGRLVTPNYYIWRNEIWGIVPENRKAHTTSSATYDHSSITKEISNSTVGPSWSFDPETLETNRRLDADIAAFYGIPFRHALPGFWEHSDVYPWTGGRESYQTACAGPSYDIDTEIAATAQAGTAGGGGTPLPTQPKADDMFLYKQVQGELTTYILYVPALGTYQTSPDHGQGARWGELVGYSARQISDPAVAELINVVGIFQPA